MKRRLIALVLCGNAAVADTMLDEKFVLPDLEPNALIACYADAAAKGHDCAAVLHPCVATFGLPADTDLAALDAATQHDLLACVMLNADRREDALMAVLPAGTDYTPGPRNQDFRFLHHRIPVSECGISSDAALADWLCEEERIGRKFSLFTTTGALE